MERNGIPTTYHNYKFRSRLEATWACFFDQCGWKWKYEPFDYNGYIPDFVLLLPHKNVLIEVKPELSLDDLKPHVEKIDRSNWKHEALLVGVGLFESKHINLPTIGLLGCQDYSYSSNLEPLPRNYRSWEEGLFHYCTSCKQYSFHAAYGSFHCRVNGCHDGDHYLANPVDAEKMWATAQNLVQWAPKMFGLADAAR